MEFFSVFLNMRKESMWGYFFFISLKGDVGKINKFFIKNNEIVVELTIHEHTE